MPDVVVTMVSECLKPDVAQRANFKSLRETLMAYYNSNDEDEHLETGGVVGHGAAEEFMVNATDIPWGAGINEIVQSGWLVKQGAGTSAFGRQSWKRRWFSLRDSGSLSYYGSSRPDAKALGTIHLHLAREVKADVIFPELSFVSAACFAVETQDRTYNLVADSKEERSRWVALISSAIEALRQKRSRTAGQPISN